MAARGSILGRKQEDAIAALLTQRNVEVVARAAGIGGQNPPPLAATPQASGCLPPGSPGSVRASRRTAPARNLGGSHHPAENDDRSGHAGVRSCAGGRGNLQSRGEGDRDRGYRSTRLRVGGVRRSGQESWRQMGTIELRGRGCRSLRGGEMKLAHRVQMLERLEGLARPASSMDQLQRALNEAAVRLTGTAANQIAHEDLALDLVLNDLQESFVRKLSDADLESLTTDLERIAFAGS